MVEPIPIEDGTRLVHRPDLESAGQLVEAEDLLLGTRRPAQEGQEVDHRLGEVSLGAVFGNGGLALALAHLRAIRVEDERDVPEGRQRVAEGLHERDVLRRVREVVLAADHVADRHRVIVDDHHEVVDRDPVRPHDDEIAEQRVVELDGTADEVVEADRLGRHSEANGGPAGLGLEARPIGVGEAQAAAAVARSLLARRLLPADGLELVGGAPAVVGESGFEQPRRLGRVELHPLALAVRTVASDVFPARNLRALVPADPQPVKVVDDVLLVGAGRAGAVSVLHAQDVGAAGMAGEQVVVEAGPRRADVQWPGRAGSHADPDRARRGVCGAHLAAMVAGTSAVLA